MPHIFEQSTGTIFDPSGKVVEVGYSGHEAGVNNPAMQGVKGIGPLPVGFYTMQPPYDHPRLGKYVIYLVPFAQNQMFGRSEFFWHGDEVNHAGEFLASDGCMIHSRATRQKGWESGIPLLQVVSFHNRQYPLELGVV